MKKVKQYIFEPAYTDNYHVIQVVDGKIEDHAIVSYWELDGFIKALERMGYERGYFVPRYKVELLRIQEELEFAQEAYDRAVQHPVTLEGAEVERYKKIIHFGEDNE